MSSASIARRIFLVILGGFILYIAAAIFGFAFPVMGGMNLGRASNLLDALLFVVPALALGTAALLIVCGVQYWRRGHKPDALVSSLTTGLGAALIIGTGIMHGILLSFSGV